MPPAQRDEALRSMDYAFKNMAPAEFMTTMGQAFSPGADLGVVEDFINTAYEMPDLS
jgi:hypothetical protein